VGYQKSASPDPLAGLQGGQPTCKERGWEGNVGEMFPQTIYHYTVRYVYPQCSCSILVVYDGVLCWVCINWCF